jgi:prepilin-type N-terminal cleavage/methylation domain-containing protein
MRLPPTAPTFPRRLPIANGCVASHTQRGMTLLEVLFAVAVMTMVAGGLLATFMQSRRLTEGSVYQNAAITIVQGYIEQMKNMDIGQMVGGYDASGNPLLTTTSFSIPVYYNDGTPDAIQTSTGTPPSITSVNSGVTPSGGAVVDNLKSYDMAKDLTALDMTSTDTLGYSSTAQVSWPSIWPGAQNYPPSTKLAGKSDLHLNLWVWITDVSVASQRSSKIYAITVIYTWAYTDGARVRYMSDIVRTLRSAVVTN